MLEVGGWRFPRYVWSGRERGRLDHVFALINGAPRLRDMSFTMRAKLGRSGRAHRFFNEPLCMWLRGSSNRWLRIKTPRMNTQTFVQLKGCPLGPKTVLLRESLAQNIPFKWVIDLGEPGDRRSSGCEGVHSSFPSHDFSSSSPLLVFKWIPSYAVSRIRPYP